MKARRDMRTLTLQAASEKTGLPAERLRRAATGGEIAYFRQQTGKGKHTRGRIYLLEAALEAWFFNRVAGTPTAATVDDAATSAVGRDIDAELIAETPRADRFV